MGNIIGCCWRHFLTVMKHKAVVFQECRKCGIAWRGIVHDLSKFSPAEFIPSAINFQGNRSPIEAEKQKKGYSLAWQHHKGHNPHHWEYWIDYDRNGNVIANEIPRVYAVEMICDWIGAGKVYVKEKWTEQEPLRYYMKVRAGRHYHLETEKFVMKALVYIANCGLDAWHMEARRFLSDEKGR